MNEGLKKKILWQFEESDYIKQWHKEIKEGLIGNLKNEYLMQRPIREPYEKYVEAINDFVGIPIFHAMVDMFIANIIHFQLEKLIDLIVDQAITFIIEKLFPSEEEIEKIILHNFQFRIDLDPISEGGMTEAMRPRFNFRKVAQAIHNLIKEKLEGK